MYEKQYFPYVINYECRDLPHVKRKNLLWKHDSVYLFQIFEKLAKAIFEWNYNKFSRSILLIKNTLRYLCFDVNLWSEKNYIYNLLDNNNIGGGNNETGKIKQAADLCAIVDKKKTGDVAISNFLRIAQVCGLKVETCIAWVCTCV